MKGLRGLITVCALLLVALGAAQVAWQRNVPDTNSARLVRDASSNLYFITRTATVSGRRLTITKYNALGTELWATHVNESGDPGHQFFITGASVSATHLAATFEVRDVASSDFVASRGRVLRLSDGAIVHQVSSAGIARMDGVAINGTVVAYLVRVAATNAGMVTFYNTTNFGSLGSRNIGTYTASGGIVLDDTNSAYTAYALASGVIETAKVSPGVTDFITQHDRAGVTEETPTHIGVDTAANRLYVLGYATFSPTDRDTYIYFVDATLGATVTIQSARSTTSNEQTSDLMVLPGAGVLASVMTSGTGITSLIRRTAAGTSTLSVDISGANVTTTRRSLGRDPSGNYLVAEPLGATGRISRVDSTNGSIRSQLTFPLGGAGSPNQLVTDSAGNCYVYWDTGTATLGRVEHATLGFSANNVTGGTTVTGTITIPANAAADQIWTLQSSNSSVATVPAQATIVQNTASVNFFVTLFGVSANTNVSINASHNGYITQRTLTVVPSNMLNVQVDQNVVIGGSGITGTATLNGVAPSGGRTVNLSSNKPAVANVPANIVIPEGLSSGNFAITTVGVNSNQGVVITATTGAVSRTRFIAVNAPSLTSISLNPGTIKGGLNSSLTLNINGPAPTGGFAIALISGAPGIVIVSATGTVPAAAITTNVNVVTTAVTSSTNVTIFATRSGIYKTATLTVTP